MLLLTAFDGLADKSAILHRPHQVGGCLTLPGKLDSYFQTTIFPRVSSYVKVLHANIGDHVCPGQVLAVPGAPELTATLSEAHPKQSMAQASFQASRGTLRHLRQTARTQATSDSLNVVAARTTRPLSEWLPTCAPLLPWPASLSSARLRWGL